MNVHVEREKEKKYFRKFSGNLYAKYEERNAKKNILNVFAGALERERKQESLYKMDSFFFSCRKL